MNERIAKVLSSETDKKYYDAIQLLVGKENIWLVDNLIYKSYLVGGLDEIREMRAEMQNKTIINGTLVNPQP